MKKSSLIFFTISYLCVSKKKINNNNAPHNTRTTNSVVLYTYIVSFERKKPARAIEMSAHLIKCTFAATLHCTMHHTKAQTPAR